MLGATDWIYSIRVLRAIDRDVIFVKRLWSVGAAFANQLIDAAVYLVYYHTV